MHRSVFLPGALALILTAWACGNDGAAPQCIVGASAACSCSNGEKGAQVCNAQHQFDACVCEPDVSGSGGADEPASGGSTSAKGGSGGDAAGDAPVAKAGESATAAGGQAGATGAEPRCGDGQLSDGEACDDGNLAAGDGCNPSCAIEAKWSCSGAPSLCNRSCASLAATCGAAKNVDCCDASAVQGGSFLRNDDESAPATVSSFVLDTFEVTVGRFRRFVDAYPNSVPKAGAGRNPNNPSDAGWDASWKVEMPADKAALSAALLCNPAADASWTDTVGDGENLPLNCPSWYEAEAFCIWDGGRLPTEAEWIYVASGGAEQRYYPWSVPPYNQFLNNTFALYGQSFGPPPAAVGSKLPNGRSKWGQADIDGSVSEWVQDWWVASLSGECNDCANLQPAQERVYRGADYGNPPSALPTANPYNRGRSLDRNPGLGFRCARNVAKP